MGQTVVPPYEDYRDDTPSWQAFEKRLRLMTWFRVGILAAGGLFAATTILWAVASRG